MSFGAETWNLTIKQTIKLKQHKDLLKRKLLVLLEKIEKHQNR